MEDPYGKLKPLVFKQEKVEEEEKIDDRCTLLEKRYLYRERIKNYQTVDDIITGSDEDTICSLEVLPCKKLVSSISGYAIVFSLYSYSDTPDENIRLIVKVTDEKQFENIREGKNNIIVKEIVLSGTSPHFVLASDYKVCKDKCTFLSDEHNYGHLYTEWREVKKGSCLLSFQEMFDDNVKHKVVEWTKNHQQDNLSSLIIQVIMGCMTLYRKNMRHGDFHLGNVFYKVLSDGEEGKYYFSYNIDGDTYYIKHHNFLFVLGDYGHMESIKPESVYNALYDLTVFFQKMRENTYLRNHQYKEMFSLLKRLFEGYSTSRTQPSISDILDNVKKILDNVFFKNADIPSTEVSGSFEF